MKKTLGIYEVDDRSSYKRVKPELYTFPELRYVRQVPGDYVWTDCTLSDTEVSSNTIILSTGQLTGSIVTPQLANVNRDINDYRDVTKIQLISSHTNNDGTLHYYVSNDSKNWIEITKFGTSQTTYDAIHHLPYTKSEQDTFNLLTIKVELRRTSVLGTSPVLNKITVIHNQLN
jgi:hypothetical protein